MTFTIIAIAAALVFSGACLGIIVAALCSASNENQTINGLMEKIKDLKAEKERLRRLLGETEG